MSAKMTFPELVEAVAAATKTSKKVSEAFLKELFATVAACLRKGESVRVARIGTFKVVEVEARESVDADTGLATEIPAHKKVTFAPDKRLAEAVNAPFSSFTAVEIDGDLTPEELERLEACSDEPAPEPVEEPAPEPVEEPVADEPARAPADRYVVPEEHEEEEYLPAPEKKGGFARGFLWGAVTMFLLYLIVGALIYANGRYFNVKDDGEEAEVEDVYDYGYDTPEDYQDYSVQAPVEATPEEPAPAVSQPEPEAAPEPKVVYDKVTRKMYLTRLASKHYGNSVFWVYIYEENKAKIKNPNKVPDGTVVVIPPASKYGIDKDDPASVSKAKAKEVALQRRFK